MILLDKEYPKQCSGCFAMRCQKCVIMNSKSIFEYLVKDAPKKKPDWCPCHELSERSGGYKMAKIEKPYDPVAVCNGLDYFIRGTIGDDAYEVGLRNGMKFAKSLIDNKKPMFEKTWIPVSERLPEKYGLYIVTQRDMDGGIVVSAAIYDAVNEFKWLVLHWWGEVIAWMERPIPYIEEDKDE